MGNVKEQNIDRRIKIFISKMKYSCLLTDSKPLNLLFIRIRKHKVHEKS